MESCIQANSELPDELSLLFSRISFVCIVLCAKYDYMYLQFHWYFIKVGLNNQQSDKTKDVC